MKVDVFMTSGTHSVDSPAMNGTVNSSTPGIPLASLQAGEHPVIPYVFVSLSVAVNVIVIIVVTLSRQLHEPRHVYWAGISLAVIFYTADWLVKAFITSDTDYLACIIYKLTICVSYPLLLSFLSLAGLDRYLAIEHYEWYKRKMTNKKALAGMFTALIINSGAFYSPYVTRHLTLNDCYYDLTHALCFVGWSVTLGAVNVVLQVKVFVVSMRAIRYYFSRRDSIRCKRIGRLDFKAALIFSVNVLPFLLCTIPLSLNTMAMCVCSKWDLNCSGGLMLQIDAYLKYSVFTPCIVMPAVYMGSSNEFQRALVHLCRKAESRASSLNRSSINRRTVVHLN